MRSVEEWKIALREALRHALRARQPQVAAVVRETLAAIENAEAADLSVAPPAQAGPIAGGVAGLGAGDVPRKILTAEAVAEIVLREFRERQEAASMYTRMERHEEANALRLQMDILTSLLAPASPPVDPP